MNPMKLINDMKMEVKLLGAFITVALASVIIGGFAYLNIKTMNSDMHTMYQEQLLPVEELGTISANVWGIRGDVYKILLIPEEKSKTQDSLDGRFQTIEDNIALYKSKSLVGLEKDQFEVFEQAWETYKTEVDQILVLDKEGKSEDARALLLDDGKAALARRAVGAAIDGLVQINTDNASQLEVDAQTRFNTSLIVILVATGFTFGLAILLGSLLTLSIARPLAKVMETARHVGEVDLNNLTNALDDLSRGDLSANYSTQSKELDIQRKDEIGKLTDTFNFMISRLHKCGVSFRSSIANLSQLVGEVVTNAENLGAASEQLAEASVQAGQATSQITATIQQIALGTSNQAESVNQTATSVEQMGRAIEGVARGAQEQSQAIFRASSVTAQISATIQQVAGNTAAVTRDSVSAADAARSGAATVDVTLQGMKNIKLKVGDSAEKVQEMGRRSEEIGAIVETIEDISSQTNLLALNAAIEAVRAGEHGKGFAVVADEVRKLAERSANSTKEIAQLIQTIQGTVFQAVQAMEEGSREVEKGVESANQSGAALAEILTAVEAVKTQADQAGKAAGQMNAAAGELVAAVDSVSAVVEENTAATEQMSANSTLVMQSIESIASVSEENSAAIEEVSASTEEMSSQVEEVTASAQELSETAQALQQLVRRFKLATS